jgi:hypothetical protein
MHYYGLKSLISSHKSPIALIDPSNSFSVRSAKVTPFIEPSFSKTEFPKEKPSILLVSAVGASGKTTTARALSFDTQLPILDLATHKAVGDNTLTGILTTAYAVDQIGNVLVGLRNGTHGIIIDGIDEGRSKTTEEGFEAFLDDLVTRSKGSNATAIVIFGRGQVLLSTWCYLVDKGADVGLLTIEPFNLDQARAYIDAQVPDRNIAQQVNYEKARDAVLDRLGAAFASSTSNGQDAFLSFIGYPPVLDAIGTLLRNESNYHFIQQGLGGDTGGPIEVELLIRICDYLINREHDSKALPNFINSIAADADASTAQQLRKSLYSNEEQCARVLCRALGRPFSRRLIQDGALNERYEAAVVAWCPDHPFLDDMRVRNAVFAAAAVARCVLSDVPEYKEVALEYARSHRPTYHLLYIMEVLGEGRTIDARCFNMLMQACSEFLGASADVSVDIEGESWYDTAPDKKAAGEIVMTVEFPDKQQERTFSFSGNSDEVMAITLGPYLVNATVTLPCHVELLGQPALEAIGECHISARNVRVDTPDLIVRSLSRRQQGDKHEAGLFIDAQKVEGSAAAVSLGGGKLEIDCSEHGLDYPLAKYVQRAVMPVLDVDLREKYLRLRRILLEFRSHKKGGLAKYRDKIEHERVLRNALGHSVLAALLQEGVLTRDPKFYHIESDQLATKLGITWHELRHHKSSHELEGFLKNVSNS